MPRRLPVVILLIISSLSFVQTDNGNWDKCSGRLERALDTIRRESNRRNRLDDEDQRSVYQHKMKSAPLEMIVSRIVIKAPQDSGLRGGGPWAKVDRCMYEPSNNSIQTRVIFNDLSVSSLVSLLPLEYSADIPGESCKMSLRLRRAGVEFYTNPIARGRGQMRIRTEYSFLEPRVVSIYAYGCRPTRFDKQIKRQDKWPPHQKPNDESAQLLTPQKPLGDKYEAAEPREMAAVFNDEDVIIANESRLPRTLYAPGARLGIWRRNDWVTKSRKRRSIPHFSWDITGSEVLNSSVPKFTTPSLQQKQSVPFTIIPESIPISTKNPRFDPTDKAPLKVITPSDFVLALIRQSKPSVNFINLTTLEQNITTNNPDLVPETESWANFSSSETLEKQIPRETREIFVDDDGLEEDSDFVSRDWQSRENVAKEMEEVFLHGASQALTRYIEKQLQPAIKETLMLAMGYTISYG